MCGAFARPATSLGTRTHYEFVDQLGKGCQSCTKLVAPTLDAKAPFGNDLAGAPEPWREHRRRIFQLSDQLLARQFARIQQQREQPAAA